MSVWTAKLCLRSELCRRRHNSDNGGEFINYALIKWVDDKDIYFTRSRPYKSNDNAHVEQKNGDVVRRHAFHYRYDTAAELKLLNAL